MRKDNVINKLEAKIRELQKKQDDQLKVKSEVDQSQSDCLIVVSEKTQIDGGIKMAEELYNGANQTNQTHEKTPIIWAGEAAKLTEGYFKPVIGENKIKFLTNGYTQVKDFMKKNSDGTVTTESRNQGFWEIEVLGKKHTWAVTVGGTKSCLWGQISAFAEKNGGDLVGKTVTLLRVGTGTSTHYTVLEAYSNPDVAPVSTTGTNSVVGESAIPLKQPEN
ncbi:MAG: hypothetical protein ACTSUW_05385 [Candidatus Heimdallarchaeota archaeon]